MGAKTFNNVKINLTLKTTTTRANLSTSSEDLAVQLGKIKKWYDDFAWSAFTAPTVEVTGTGNAITSASWSTSNGKLTLTKGSSFSTVSISRDLTSGTKIGTITINGTATDLYCQTNTDTKVTQTAVGSTYTNYRPLVIGASNSATAGFSPSTVTDTTFTTQAIYCQPSSGAIYATTFNGNLGMHAFESGTDPDTKTGTFAYGGAGGSWSGTDWVGLQVGGSNDTFQIQAHTSRLIFRQNDSATSSSTWSTSWSNWMTLLTPADITAGTGLSATVNGTSPAVQTVTINHSNSVTAVTTASLLKFKYDAQGHITGSSAVTSSDLPAHTHYEQDVKFDTSYSYKPQDNDRFPSIPQPLINTMRTNKFVFLPPSSITIEHSTDGGSTYTDSGYTDTGKCNIFTSRQIGAILIGPNTTAERTTSMRTMVTITRDSRYTRIDRFYIWFSTSGHTAYVDIQYATNAADTTWVDWRTNIQLLGWSGPNLINGPVLIFGASDTHVKKIRFIFRYTTIRANYKTSPSRIFEIAAYSDYPAWTAANNMMMNDHLYYWDKDQIAYFPAEIKVPTQLRVHCGNYGALFRNDGTNTHILLTNSGEAESGSWNSLRPFSINNSAGWVTMSEGLKVNTKDGAFLEIHGLTTTSYAYGSSSPKIRFTNSPSDQNAELIWDDHDTYCTPASLTLIGNHDGTFFCAPRIRLFSAPTAGSLIDIDDTNNKNFHLRYKSSVNTSYANIISVYPGVDQNGCGVIFNNTGGGLCIIGGGEAANALNQTVRDASTSPYGTAWTYGTENMVIGADTSIYFVSGANSLTTTNHTDWTHLKTALFDSNGYFRPSVDNKGQIGASNYKWRNVYATTLNGTLNGDITAEVSRTSTSDDEYFVPFIAKFDDAFPDDGQSVAKKPYLATDCYFWRQTFQSGSTTRHGIAMCLGDPGFSSEGGIIMCDGTDTSENLIFIYAVNPYLEFGEGPNLACLAFNGSSTSTDVAAFIPVNSSDLGHPDYKWRYVHATSFVGNLTGNVTGNVTGQISGTIASSTTATTQDSTDSSTKVATTAHVTNKLYLAGVYYNSNSNFASAPWGKVWEYNINAASAHRHISFILEQGYQGTNVPNTLGILMIHIATNSSKAYNGGHVFWLAASSDLNKDDIAVTYQGSSACIIQIWIKTTARYQSFHLHPLYSGVLGSASAIMGTYSSPTSGAANYAGTLIASSYTTLNNPTKMLKTIHSSRPTSANFESSNSAGMTLALATASMTTAKPMTDGHIMNFEWDNGGKWGAQLFLPDADGSMVEYRTQSSATDWADRNWIPLLDSISGAGKDGYIAYPNDGQYTASVSSVTGALVITLPFGMTAIMLSFIVDVYNYVDNTTVSYRVSGYTYNSDSKWYSCTALCIGSYAGALSNLTVRFGHNGTKAQVQIGETTTAWTWPQVRVRNIMLGHTTASADKTFITNRKNWTVSFVTTNISNVTKTIQNTHIGKTLAASATQTGTVGGKGIPVYLNSGTITACSTPASGAWWSTSNALVPQISTSGVLEIGRYIDLHATAASTNNFDYRFEAVGTKEMMFSSADTDNVLTLNTAGYNQIRFKTTATDKSYTALGIVSYPLSASGQTMLFQCGGNMVIGGGEFAAAAYTRKDSTGKTQVGYDNIVTTEREKLYLGADTEVQIIANAQNLATYSNNDHVVWKFQANGQLITPGTITDTLDLQHTMIHQSVRSESNCVTLAQWIVNGAASTTYRPSISFHNTGGDSTDKGAIILSPYHHNTDPWGKNVGLYIGKNILRLDGVNVALQNAASLNTMINALSTGSSAPVDADYYVAQYAGGGTTTTTYHRRPVSALYSYIRSKHIKSAIAVQTGSSKKAKITLQTLMTWLITTKKYIPSGTTEDIIIKTTWAFANNDILRFTANGVNYEMSLAGVIIEFKGLATSYNAGEFTFTITSAPTVISDTPTSGYTRFPANTTAVYHCNGSGYSPTWTVNMNKAVQQLLYQSTSSVGYGYAEIVIGSVFSNWTMLWLEFMGASYGQSSSNPHSGAGLIPLSLVRSIGVVSAIADQYHIPIGYNPGNTTADQYLAVGYKDDNTLSLSRGGGGGPIGKVKIYGIC